VFFFGRLRIACSLQVRETSPDLVWTQPKAGSKLVKRAFALLEFLVDLGANIASEFIDSKCSLL
jgi:hypothetical protein